MMTRPTDGQAVPVAHSATREVTARVMARPFDERDDPRLAEREMGDFALRWAFATLQRMGVMREPGERHELEALRRGLGVAPKYDRYFAALVRRLAAEGLLTLDGPSLATTERVRGYALERPEEQAAEFDAGFRRRHPGCAGLLGFMVRCLGRFEEILTGRTDAADILFQDGMEVFANAFRGDVVADHFNAVVADAARAAAERGVGAAKVRVLEVGAGTGGTTAAILEALEPLGPGAVEFCFTDLSNSFLRHARRRFGERYPWLVYRTLDVEADLAAQGFEPHAYDVVVAANVLHDTRDVEATLRQTAWLLKPGGLLVLNEFTAVKDCLFFSGALLHGYWLFEDPERRLPDTCLLSVPLWREAQERAGFALLAAFVLPTQSPDAGCSQSVMLCEAPATAGDTEEEEDRSGVIGRWLEQDILALLGEERAAAYSARRPLMEMGLDSIELVELKSLVRGRFGVKLPPAFLFENETQEKMALALAAAVPGERLRELPPAPSARPAAAPREGTRAGAGAIAVVGVACRFPGGADSPEAFWNLLERGGDAVGRLPAGRWGWPGPIDPEGRHRGIDRGGFLDRIDRFDARFFRISPREADLMDPQQRLLLELSWEALEDAGHRPSELAGRKVGVFVGVCQSDYRDVLVAAREAAEGAGGYVGSGTAFAMLSNRLSYFYDFKGPSLTVDTACSSSLFALHGAVTALRRGECEEALVGAVNLLASPTISQAYYEAGMLSPTGRCRTFDASADGYVRGEGGAMLLLKPLARAEADGDAVYGLIAGTAVNHGGQATTLTAPKPDAQAEVVEAAWRQAGASPDTAGYVEAHGTGTPLGDPIEVSGLAAAFDRLYRAAGKEAPAAPHCGLGSVKSNVGHLEAAAGLAGLVKVLMSMRHGQIPGTLHFRRLNPEIDLAGTPFYVADRRRPWPRSRDGEGRELPRRAGVSSFGFGGANAHAVVEEYPEPAVAAAGAEAPQLVPLSAKTEEQLRERALGLLAYLERQAGPDGGAGGGGELDGVLADLQGVLRSRFGVGGEPAPDLEWEELGWGAVESRLFLAAVEETCGVRLGSRSLIELPCLGSLAERIARDRPQAGISPGPETRLAGLAYTLQIGREPMEERAAFVVRDRGELAASLRRFAAGDREGCCHGYARSAAGRPGETEAALARCDLPRLAALWVEGAAIDWPRLHAGSRLRRVQLPTYPFARECHWVRAAEARPAPHPLLGSGEPRIPEHRFAVRLTGDEPFLAGHVVQGRRTLPGVAYLEMARAALERATSAAGPVSLRSFTWLQPLVVDRDPVDVELRLVREGDNELACEVLSRPKGTAEPVLHGQGRIAAGSLDAGPALDVAAVRARCSHAAYRGDECYRAFADLGYEYGPAQQGIETLYVGVDEVLAELSLPAAAARDGFVLHPALADSAVQATLGFALPAGRNGGGPALPFELRSAEILGPCAPRMWAWVRRTGAGTFDVDLCGEDGRPSARFGGLTLRPSKAEAEPGSLAAETFLVPAWEPAEAERRDVPAGPTAIVGGTEAQRAALAARCPDARPLAAGPGDGVERLREILSAWGEVGHLVWIVPPDPSLADSPAGDSLLAAQADGALFGFQLIKTLLAEGYGARPLAWTVVTTAAQAVHPGEPASPAHAGVHGLVGSMVKEHLHWTVRLADLPAVDAESPEEVWDGLLALPGDPHGNAWAWRGGRWHRQRLVPYHPAAEAPAACRPGGVYVVVGGAGGVGEAWTEALLRRMPAQVVWIGRRPKDAALQARLDRLAALGPAPLYLTADATDRDQLAAARDAVKRAFGRIDGVIHAAIVLRDRSLENMAEEDFAAGLAAKADVSVRLAQAFAGEPLDFVLFFSSMLAFLKWPGQSNYVAGCAFADAFAGRLAAAWPARVRVVNWGYWGGVGAAASERHQSIMARRGFGSIGTAGALRALDGLVVGPARQLLYLELRDPAAALEGVAVAHGELAIQYEAALPSSARAVARTADAGGELPLPSGWARTEREIDDALARLLGAQLQAIGPGVPILDRFARWWKRSLAELEARGHASAVGASAAWRSWEERKGEWLRDPSWKAHVELAEVALRALPDVLTGHRAATDVLFADLDGGAQTLIARVYREDSLSRLCNEALAAAVVRAVEERRRLDPGGRVRILEIGAGTGATSEVVFRALRPYEDLVEEYAFTDLSRAFLAVAKKGLPELPPYLRLETFDAEAPPAGQGIATGSYDLAIATNVLHATRDVRATLRNAKAALRTNGLLLLNEISGNSLFHHLTFGLLEGWWLFADPELRAPGGPAVAPETWRAVLTQEGFRGVAFPTAAAHALGQQVVIAESDGFVRQRLAAPAAPPPERPAPAAVGTEAAPAPKAEPPRTLELDTSPLGLAGVMAQPREAAEERLRDYLRLRAAETLGADPASLHSRSRPFADALLGELGMDSLSSNSLRNVVRRELGADLAVQQIIAEKVHRIVDTLYEQLLLNHVSSLPRPGEDEETETFVF